MDENFVIFHKNIIKILSFSLQGYDNSTKNLSIYFSIFTHFITNFPFYISMKWSKYRCILGESQWVNIGLCYLSLYNINKTIFLSPRHMKILKENNDT